MEPTTGIEPFARLVAQVMTSEPYASAERVFWVVDNGSSHRGQASVTRMTKAWPTARLVHLPVHASWLNQAEIFFSILQRKVLTPNDLTDLDALAARILAFQDPLQRHRHPVRLELHPHRPRPAPPAHRRPRARARHGPGSRLIDATTYFRREPLSCS